MYIDSKMAVQRDSAGAVFMGGTKGGLPVVGEVGQGGRRRPCNGATQGPGNGV